MGDASGANVSVAMSKTPPGRGLAHWSGGRSGGDERDLAWVWFGSSVWGVGRVVMSRLVTRFTCQTGAQGRIAELPVRS
jgi:hypothetical protein